MNQALNYTSQLEAAEVGAASEAATDTETGRLIRKMTSEGFGLKIGQSGTIHAENESGWVHSASLGTLLENLAGVAEGIQRREAST